MIPSHGMGPVKGSVTRRKFMLLAGLVLTLALCVWPVGGAEGLVMLAGAIAVVLLLTPSANIRMIMRLHRARPIPVGDWPWIQSTVRDLAARAGLPAAPALYLVPSSVPNAFATGDRGAAGIALSDGSLRLFDRRELRAVLAHEISHIANGDGRLALATELLRRATGTGAFIGLLLIVILGWTVPELDVAVWVPLVFMATPIIAFLLQRALSRTCELAADDGAVALTGDPQALAAALTKVERATRSLWARLFRVPSDHDVPYLLRTHPETAERVERLLARAGARMAPREHRPAASPRPRRPVLVTLGPRVYRTIPIRVGSIPIHATVVERRI